MKKKQILIIIITIAGKLYIFLYFHKYGKYITVILTGMYIILFYLHLRRKNNKKYLELGYERLREKHDFRGYSQDDDLKKKEIVEKELAKLYSNLF